MSEQVNNRSGFITPQTWVPIGLAGTLILVIFGAKVWIDAQFEDLSTALSETRYEIRTLSGRLDTAMLDRWRGADMELWAEKLARQNPTLQVPIVHPNSK